MTRHASAVLLAVLLGASAQLDGQVSLNSLTGTFVTTDFGGEPTFIVLRASGSTVKGTIYQSAAVPVHNGKVVAGVVTFSITTPGDGRSITYAGKSSGNEIAFTRSVKVREAASGNGIFGESGPNQFVARRTDPLVPVLGALVGNWQQNVSKSSSDPPTPPARVPYVQRNVLRLNGSLGSTQIGVNDQGWPQIQIAVIRADGTPYALHANQAVIQLAEGRPAMPTWTSRAVNERTLESTSKNPSSRNTVVVTQTVAPDGQSFRVIRRARNAHGAITSTDTLLFERSGPQ